MLTALVITIALAAGALLLALTSDAFAYELSRGVEAAFDFFEYRAAHKAAERREFGPAADERVAYGASYSAAS